MALNDVDFEIAEAVTGLLGPNGAGKSTAIKLFLGLIEPTEGTAEVLGETAATNVGSAVRLGYMPEHDCLPHNVSAAEFLAHMAEVSGLPRGTRADPRGRHAAPRRPVRGALPADRGVLDRNEAAREARAGARARSGARLPRRAGERARPDGPRGDARADPEDEPGVRDQPAVLVAHHGRRRADLRPHPRARGGRVVHQGEVSTLHARDGDGLRRGDRSAGRVPSRRCASDRSNRGSRARTVVVPDVVDDRYDRIRDALVASGAPLRRLAPHRRTLVRALPGADTPAERGS